MPTSDETAIAAITRLGRRTDAYRLGQQAQLLSREAFADGYAVFDAAFRPGIAGSTVAFAATVLGWFHWGRFCLLTGEEADQNLRMALDTFGMLATKTPELVPEDALAMIRSGSLVPGLPCEAERAGRRMSLARETGDEVLFNEALTALAKVVAQMPQDDPGVLWARADLAKGWRERAERLSDLASARRAVDIGERLVAPPFDTHPLLPSLLSDLALAWLARFHITHDRDDLRRAAERARQSTSVPTETDYATRSRILSNAAIVLSEAASHESDPGDDATADRSRVVDLHRDAAQETPLEDRDLPGRLANLGRDLFMEHRRTGDPHPLDESVSTLRRALSLAPPGHEFLGGMHLFLAGALFARYVRSPDSHAADLDAAIDHERAALEFERRSPSGRVQPGQLAANLSSMLRQRYRATGNLDDLEEAMEHEAEP